MIGENADLTYAYDYLGAGPETLAESVAGRHGFAEKLRSAERPLIIVGQGASTRADGLAVLVAAAAQLAPTVGAVKDGWNGFSVLHTAAARVGAPRSRLRAGRGRPDGRRQMAAGRRRRAVQLSVPTRSTIAARAPS